MASTPLDVPPGLLDLPAEVRNLIYKFAFQQPKPMRLRCPSQRRLRPSRPSRDDARGLLDTCHLIRSEAITFYYSLNALVFRSEADALAFMSDPDIHPLIRPSLTHIAVDFGDTNDADAILKDHISLVDSCVGSLPRLRALETRFYARTLDACSSSHFRTLAMAFDSLDTDINTPPSPRSPRSSPRHFRQSSISSTSSSPASSPLSTCSSICWESKPEPEPLPVPDMSALRAEVLEQYCFTPSAAIAFAHSKLKFSVAASSEHYPGLKHDKLICYNLRIGVDGVANALGPAKEAVKQRISRVGMLPRPLSDMYDDAIDGGFHQRVRSTIASCARIDVGVS
ncbi:hypothetical protein G647_02935 [Cladophialophora carrionii CBS 160.54]|uniref:2EXR domain-containing protein n=1 Tax=Cladophialophora carrionii CBS 160.54 TaxID=1279043 RepID=V9DIK8_9EURO|nr:uncharacterized protein G647_02935 [Cladophialophora carrionii CBS 160.54]ETI26158.1 hypothetical protein G647_02935 [Cladophialophora carrionii CBS 160.54]